jgi:hypothetical protein
MGYREKGGLHPRTLDVNISFMIGRKGCKQTLQPRSSCRSLTRYGTRRRELSSPKLLESIQNLSILSTSMHFKTRIREGTEYTSRNWGTHKTTEITRHLRRMMEIRRTQLYCNILYLLYSFIQATCFDPLKGSSSGHRSIYRSHMIYA